MDRNSLQYQMLKQRVDHMEHQMGELFKLLYSLSLDVTKLHNSQSEEDAPELPTRTTSQPPQSSSPAQQSAADAINRLLASSRS